MTVLLRVEGLGKDFPRTSHRADRWRALGQLLGGGASGAVHTVLDGIGFEVRRGESLAIIGENGAGKSTLLKLVTGVLVPSRGRIEHRARIGALLELGAGFHPEHSGRDNVRMAAALMGLDAKGAAARMPEIEAFAEIGDLIDEPVKHYSNGQVVRLGFAVIAATRPELLITDEVLAVGDERFQRKCLRWLDGYLEQGGTLLLVAHSRYHVQRLCRRALWLDAGRMRALGEAQAVSRDYAAFLEAREAAERPPDALPTPGALRVVEVVVDGQPTIDGGALKRQQGASVTITAEIAGEDALPPVLSIGWLRADGTPVYGVDSRMDGICALPVGAGRWRFTVDFDLPLLPGDYVLRLFPMDAEALRIHPPWQLRLVVEGESREFGLVRLPHRWSPP